MGKKQSEPVGGWTEESINTMGRRWYTDSGMSIEMERT